MKVLSLSPEDASFLASRARALGVAARTLVSFADSEPELAARAGVEIQALEARAILRRGALSRILSGAHLGVPREDIDDMSRLEVVTSMADDRIQALAGSLSSQPEEAGVGKLTEVLGMASMAVGLLNSVI